MPLLTDNRNTCKKESEIELPGWKSSGVVTKKSPETALILKNPINKEGYFRKMKNNYGYIFSCIVVPLAMILVTWTIMK